MMASFFWHGGPLTLYEAACLRSFVKAGAAVRLFSFDDTLHVPAGVELWDARLYAEVSETQCFQQGHHDVSLAAFSDMFRYRLLADAPGWWFDTDVMCLQPVDAFAPLVAKSPGLMLGEESPGQVNGAVMHVSACAIARTVSLLGSGVSPASSRVRVTAVSFALSASSFFVSCRRFLASVSLLALNMLGHFLLPHFFEIRTS